jgi:tubby-related protein 1
MFVLESKMPSYENGNYRLNFHGRVNLPSVKNFQLVSPTDLSDVVCQFGKVKDDKFHLDFKAPLNAFQAFSIALTQFVSALS